MTKATVDLTPAEKDELVGGPHGDPFPIPSEAQFDASRVPGRLDAPELEAMARRLIALDALKIGHLSRFTVLALWAKAGGTGGGKPKFGTASVATSDERFISSEDDREPFDAKVRLAADNLREAKATRWQVGYELAFQLSRIGLHVTQETGAERLVLVAPDAAYFIPQMDVFGPQSPEIRRQFWDVKQTRFQWVANLTEQTDDGEEEDYDPSVDLPDGVESEAGPVDGGAPDAEWAETGDSFGWLREAAQRAIDENAAEPTDAIHDPETGEARPALVWPEDHAERVRANFNTGIRLDDGIEFCEACGLDIDDHDPEVCQGGTPEIRKRRRKATTNGSHDPAVAEVAGITR